ncbi:MAG: GntR family transcriptional regulator [Clostridiales bacterium]|jgi:GntR family transcriptional regulator|nr:GntR family transcriptional regulator [Clostridiales bacterium]
MFTIDSLSRQPLYEQLIEQLEQLVLTGVLEPGSRIPTVRGLSCELSVNPNTIQKAYSDLDRRGVICSVPGRGCYITDQAVTLLRQECQGLLPLLEDQLRRLKLAGIGREAIEALLDQIYPISNEGGQQP